LRFYLRSKPGNEKQQAKLMFIGMSVPLLTAFVTELFPYAFGFEVVPLASSTTTITALFIAYAMLRYKLMSLTPSLAAENIIKTMADYLLVINREKTMAFLSDSILSALKYKNKDQLSGKLRETFPEKAFDTVIDRIEKESYIKDLETTLKTKEGKSIPVSLNGSVVKDNTGETLGYVLIMRDMSKIVELITRLQDRTAELEKSKKELERSKGELEMKIEESERLNKLSVGRELKMVELKKRIRELGG
jgi:PAS domain S-box-containing protein